MKLTDLQVNKLSPKDTFYDVPDGDGLYIRVMPAGTKTWIFRYMFDGRQRLMTLGRYPGISLAEARERHSLARQDLEGKTPIDPGQKQKDEKAARKKAPTISDLIEEFWDIELKNKKSGIETQRLLNKDVLSRWGNRKVEDVKRRDIVLLLDRIRGRAPITANRVLGAMTRLFNFAAERGIIEDSPCTRIRKPTEKGRDRVLTDDEIKLLWNALDLENKEVDMYHVSKLAIKMILLTGQRPGEICGMTWDEIDNGFWNIPAERMKGNQAQRVPLTGMALEVIERARIYSGDSKYVFVSPRSPKYTRKKPDKGKPKEEDLPLTAHALSRALSRHWADMGFKDDMPRFTPHDLRRTLRTRLASLGVNDVIAERVLGHKLQGVLAVYNRYDYDQEKRQALEQWERELLKILGLSAPIQNVIPLGAHNASKKI